MPSATNAANVSSPVQLLRAHTQALHQALEATPAARALLSPHLKLAGYADILGVWAAAWLMLEPAVFATPVATDLPELLPFPRARLAQADLQYLGCDGAARSGSAGPRPFDTLDGVWTGTLASRSGFIGTCYVLRGASLGGRVIARHLELTLGLDAAHGAAFFNAESGDGLSWVQWMRRADQVLMAEDAIDDACRAAADTFALLLELFGGTHLDAADAGPRLVAHPGI